MNMLTSVYDGLKNVLTGRGTNIDRRSHNWWHHMRLPDNQVEAAYRSSWLIRRIVDLIPDDMVREGRTWELEQSDVDKIEEVENKLKLEAALLDGLVYGRLGGGVVILGTDGNMEAPPREGEKLLYVKALPRAMVSLGDYDWDIDSETFGEPEYFTLNGARRRDDIHPSRVITFHGERVPSLMGQYDEFAFWGDSIVDVVNEAVKDVNTATGGFASLIDEGKIDVFKLAGLAEILLQPGGDAKVRERVEVTNMSKSTHRGIFLDGEDDWQQKQINWAGMPDLIQTYLMVAAGAADIPATRLYGKAPDGQNSTGESDDRNYRSAIKTRQNRVLRPALNKLDRFLLPTAGVKVDAKWDFAPLSTPTQKEKADLEKQAADTAKAWSSTGLIPREALARGVQSRLTEEGTYPALKEALDKLPADQIVDPEENIIDPSALTAPGKPGQARLPKPANGNQQLTPAQRKLAANDAVPRTLYVMRPVTNAADIIRWARAQGFTDTLAPGDMHVTLAYSRQPIDWMKVESTWDGDAAGKLTIKPGGARLVEPLGDAGAIVLLFNSSELSWRHEAIKRAGASWDYDEFQPHVTLTYAKPEGLDLKTVTPYRGPIVLGPEVFDEVDPSWNTTPSEA